MVVREMKDYRTGRKYLVIRETFRTVDGTPSSRNIRNYGYITDENREELYKKANEELEKLKDKLENIEVQLDLNLQNINSKIDENLGYAVLEKVYEQIGMKNILNKTISANKRSDAFDVNSAVKLLVFSRILKPDSKFQTFEGKPNFFGNIFKDLKLENVYSSLSDLCKAKDAIQINIHKNVSNLYERDLQLVFYDVTNYYFEIDYNDGYDDNNDPLGLRYEGVSKEERTLPIVQMGLLMDIHRVPIAYKLFTGNTHDQSTLIPILEEFQKIFEVKTIKVIADKGLNSGKNLEYLIKRNHKFIVSQMVRTKDQKFRDKILEEEGYN
jgi:transposase